MPHHDLVLSRAEEPEARHKRLEDWAYRLNSIISGQTSNDDDRKMAYLYLVDGQHYHATFIIETAVQQVNHRQLMI